MKKLFLLDAYALIYRAHFAFGKNPRINSKGFNTGAILGFTNSLLEILTKFKPTHVGVAFDTKAPTVRHIEFVEYKAHREAQPEEIQQAVPIIKDMLRAWHIPILEMDGYEADDVVGTLAKQAGAAGIETYMMTLDKDYAQLVDKNVFLYKVSSFGRGAEIYDVEKILEKWEVERVDQVADILGLWGDAVDNIPGIPGIGEKTAKKLIKEFGSVENLVANADKLKGKQKENVENFGAQGILSKKLATIITDVPIEFNEADLELSEPDKETLIQMFDELEFRTLKNRVFAEEKEAAAIATKPTKKDDSQMSLFGGAVAETSAEENTYSEKKTILDFKRNYALVDTDEKIEELVEFLSMQDEFCFDTETDNIDSIEANLVGMSFCYVEGDAFYIPFSQDKEEAQKRVELFRSVLENKDIRKIGQNIKYDIIVLKNYGVDVQGELFDTMLAHYILQPEQRHNMDVLAENFLNYSTVSIETLIGKKGKDQKTMADLSPEEIKDYACEDADITFQLKEKFAPLLAEINQTDLLCKVETPLVSVLADMEYAGVRVDKDTLAVMSKDLNKLAIEAQDKIFELAGQEFNVASPKQLGEILFDKLKLIEKPKKTKTGQYATGEDILSDLASEHEIVERILEFREYQKLRSTYVDALPKMISPRDGMVHTDYRQAVAATGRLSSNNPNLQNIPIRTEKGREIRKAFVPRGEDFTLYSADYSQIELRIMASFSGDESMIDAFRNGRDIHATTAAKVFKVALEDVEPAMRRKAKEVNFGIIYGISPFGLSQNLKIPRKEAAEIIDTYFEEFPAIKTYMDKCVNDAREVEYAQTILGRRRYLPEINSRNATQRGFAERNAVNAPIQGSAADMIKLAMINIHAWMKEEKLKSKMILQVHDELVFDVHNSELEIIQNKIPELMANALKLEVPAEVGTGTGKNWLEAH